MNFNGEWRTECGWKAVVDKMIVHEGKIIWLGQIECADHIWVNSWWDGQGHNSASEYQLEKRRRGDEAW